PRPAPKLNYNVKVKNPSRNTSDNNYKANILEKTANYDKEDTLVFHPDAAARYGIEGHEQTFIDFYKSCQDYEDNERNYEITEEDKKYYNFSEGIEKKTERTRKRRRLYCYPR
ncbi:13801_t:CDS:2, partial [Racocetra persica]